MSPMYNYICERCGCYLDPGEHCDCLRTYEHNRQMVDELLAEDQDGQMTLKEMQDCGTHTRL